MHPWKPQLYLTTALVAAGCSFTEPSDIAQDTATDGDGQTTGGETSVAACSGPNQSKVECEGERPSGLRAGDPAAPTSVRASGNSVEHGEQRTDPLLYQPGPEGVLLGAPGPIEQQPAICDASDLQGLAGDALTDYLTGQTMNCLRYLWMADGGVQAALADANVEYVANKITALAPSYDGSNSLGHRQLWFFVRVAYYHAFFGSIPAPDASTDAAVEAGLQAMAANQNILADGAEAGAVLYELVHAADASDLAYAIRPLLQDVLDTLAVGDRLDQYEQSLAVDAALFAVARQVTNQAFWSNAVDMDGLIASLSLLAQDGNGDLIPSYEWVVNNAIWALGKVAIVPAYHQSAVSALVTAQDALPYLSVPFLWTIKVLDLYANCVTSDPLVILCMADVKPAVEALLFPNTFTFDDGAMVVRTPLTLPQLQPLYHAAKEVGAQFNRITETIVPITGDPNGVLEMIIYGTRKDYKDYHTLLYGLSSNNGGIYIEQQGAFYTYERLPSESIYTLEELFRHEYVHYLAGRFLIEGFWGAEPIYSDGRMIWFDEGLAEFLVWSTPGGGVLPRKSLVEGVAADGGVDRLSVADLLHAEYDGFTFYRYAGLFFLYLYEHDIGTLRELLGYANSSDISGFDALVESLSADLGLEASYQAFLDDLVAGVGTLDNPSTSFPNLATLDTADITTIETAFHDTRLGAYAQCSLSAIAANPRFSCRGVLTTVKQVSIPDPDVTWGQFDTDLDELIGELLSDAELDNFQHVTCRFARMSPYPLTGGYYTLADFHCEGPLGVGPHVLLPHLEQMQQDLEDTRHGAVQTTCSEPIPGDVHCTSATSTRLYPVGTAQSVLQAEFDDGVQELHNQLYATRPSYYRDLDCFSLENEHVVNYPGNQIYMVGTIGCNAVFEP